MSLNKSLTQLRRKTFDYVVPFEHENHAEYIISLAANFEKRGKSFLPVVDADSLGRELMRKGFDQFVSFNEFVEEDDCNNLNLSEELKRLAGVFSYSQLRDVIFPEWYTFGEPENVFYWKLVGCLRFYEHVFVKHEISCRFFIQYVGDHVRYSARRVASYTFSGQTLYCGSTLMFNRLNFTRDPRGVWAIEPNEIQPTNEERAFVENWIDKALQERKVIFPDPLEVFQPKIPGNAALLFLRFLWKNLADRQKKPGRTIKYIFRRHLLPYFEARLARNLYQQVDLKTTKYIYFPLHYAFDLALTSKAKPFVDQFYVIELLHRCLPVGYKLLIKEHPASVGTTSFLKLRKASQLPDVTLLPINANSHEIIERAEAVAVITSTVGAEALYQAKPLLTFGDTYYTGQEVTIDVRNLHEIQAKVRELLSFQPDRESIIKMFVRAYRDSYPINQTKLVDSHYSGSDKVVSEAFRRVAPTTVDAMIHYCEEKQNKDLVAATSAEPVLEAELV